MKAEGQTRSIHRLLATELTVEEIDQVTGGDEMTSIADSGTVYDTRDMDGHTIRRDGDVGGTWRWSF